MRDILDTYWRRNIQLKVIMLSIWALASLVLAILLVEPLNEAEIGGFPLGFWMAQQGAIFTFVALIFVYARIMDTRDSKLEEELETIHGGPGHGGPGHGGPGHGGPGRPGPVDGGER